MRFSSFGFDSGAFRGVVNPICNPCDGSGGMGSKESDCTTQQRGEFWTTPTSPCMSRITTHQPRARSGGRVGVWSPMLLFRSCCPSDVGEWFSPSKRRCDASHHTTGHTASLPSPLGTRFLAVCRSSGGTSSSSETTSQGSRDSCLPIGPGSIMTKHLPT